MKIAVDRTRVPGRGLCIGHLAVCHGYHPDASPVLGQLLCRRRPYVDASINDMSSNLM
jgi:hypothetical protein